MQSALWVGVVCVVGCGNVDLTGQSTVASMSGPPAADLCGTWNHVELVAQPSATHMFCRGLTVSVPPTIEPVGDATGASASLEFRRFDTPGASGNVTCKYAPAKGAPAGPFMLSSCNHGVRAGQSIVAQQFELDVSTKHGHDCVGARVALGDPVAPPDAYLDYLGSGGLAGVRLHVPAAAVGPFSGIGLADGPPFEIEDFVAGGTSGLLVAGPSVSVTGPSTLGPGVQLVVPFDAAYVASLPAGSRDTLAVQQIASIDGPRERIESAPIVGAVDNAASNVTVTLASASFYLPTIADLTPIQSYGGALLDQGVNVYVIWAGDFTAQPTEDPRAMVRQFIADLPSSSWYGILGDYGIANRTITLAGETSLPSITGFAKRSDGQRAIYVDAVKPTLDAGTFPSDPDGIYLVIGAPGVDETSPNGKSYCDDYCGYHTYTSTDASGLKYGFIGHPKTCAHAWTCGVGGNPPHGGNIDGVISVVAHEIVETVTDPQGGGWHGITELGYSADVENADKCAWRFTSMQGDGTVASPSYNLESNGHRYEIQDNWVNQDGGYCAMAVETVAITATPQFAGGLAVNEIGSFTVHLTNTGASYLDARRLAITGKADGLDAGDPIPVTVPVGIAPGASADVTVAVQAPLEIDGNTQIVPFRFHVRDPGNGHTFAAAGEADIEVRRASVLVDQSECVAMTLPPAIDEYTWFHGTAQLHNTGTTIWKASQYRPVALPLDIVHPNISLPATLLSDVPPGSDAVIDFWAYSPPGTKGQTFDVAVSMANPASDFQAGCAGSTSVNCDGAAGNACGSCGTTRCDGSCNDPAPSDYGTACGSCGGTTQCDDSCSVNTPGNLGAACGCGGTIQCNGTCSDTQCHTVVFRMADIDDDAYLWVGDPASNDAAVCRAHIGVDGGGATCDLGAILAGQPLDFTSVPFTLKLGNGGGFTTMGEFFLSIDGVEVELSAQLPVIAHTGWTHRQKLTINFVDGTYVASPADACITIFDCMN